MTVKIINASTASGMFKALEQLAGKFVVFRGHQNSKWRLSSTLSRHHRAPYHPNTSWTIDEMLRHFLINLKSIGMDPPYRDDTRRARLEFGRHYGIPSPLIDFSRSPYVAAFFAFSGVRSYESKRGDRAAIYCVNVMELAGAWARLKTPKFDAAADAMKISRMFTDYHNNFVYAEPPFEKGYPPNLLKFIDLPASWNRRMQRQMGCFLYDSMNYQLVGLRSLEDFLGQSEVPRHPHGSEPMLTKIVVPHNIGREVLEHLDLMGISATHLYDSHEGAAIDVVNEYGYSKKTARAWDLKIELPES
jgi:hypothetical protein